MHFLAKICLAGSILFLSFFQTIAQDEETTSAEWYQNFFTRDSKLPIEKALKNKADQFLEAVEIQDDSAQARILLESGLIHLTRTFNYDTAMEFFIRSLIISDSLDHPSGKIFSYLAISDVFEVVGNHEKSTQFLEK